MIAHQTVETVEILPHVRRPGCNIDPRRRSKPEHRSTPCPIRSAGAPASRIESRRTSIRRPLRNSTTEHRRTRRRCRHRAPWREPLRQEQKPCSPAAVYHARVDDIYPASLPPSPAAGKTLHAAIHSLQTPQPAPGLSQTTSSVLHSQFAHSSSAPLNAAREQSALLRRIPVLGGLNGRQMGTRLQ
jgi:hypothetical protein